MKKTFQAIGIISLVVLSFYTTPKLSLVIKNNDDIMKEIKSIAEEYKVEPIDAKIENETIIPGLSGSNININESYKKMKKINVFNSDLLVYEKVKPNISLEKVFNKYIINGNSSKMNVSLIFLLKDNDQVEEIIKVLGHYKASFFTDLNWFENNNDKIMNLISLGHTIGNLGDNNNYTKDGVSWMNTIVTKIGSQKDTYCYLEKEDDISLNRCAFNGSYTIKTININKNLLLNVKENLKNGAIIAIEVNEINNKELATTIKHIVSKGYEIVNIEKMLTE